MTPALRARAKGLAGFKPKIDQTAIASTCIPVPDKAQQAGVVRQITNAPEDAARIQAALASAKAVAVAGGLLRPTHRQIDGPGRGTGNDVTVVHSGW